MVEAKHGAFLGEESLKPGTGAWLGGVFEVGGTLGFNNGYPMMQFADNRLESVEVFEAEFGGNSGRYSEGLLWKLHGNGPLPLIASMALYSPSRAHFVEAAIRWAATERRLEKLEISRSVSMRERTPVSLNQYRVLLSDSDFLAGVLDARGSVHGGLKLSLHTKNTGLLEAFKCLYGGHVSTWASEVPRRNGPKEMLQNTYLYMGDAKQMSKVLSRAYGHLRFPGKWAELLEPRPIVQFGEEGF